MLHLAVLAQPMLKICWSLIRSSNLGVKTNMGIHGIHILYSTHYTHQNWKARSQILIWEIIIKIKLGLLLCQNAIFRDHQRLGIFVLLIQSSKSNQRSYPACFALYLILWILLHWLYTLANIYFRRTSLGHLATNKHRYSNEPKFFLNSYCWQFVMLL